MADDRQVVQGNTISLGIEILDSNGNPIDADAMPQVEIFDANSTLIRALSSTSVARTDIGRYKLDYAVSEAAATGVWDDHWHAVVNGFSIVTDLVFVVYTAGHITPGPQIGDPGVVNYTDEEILGINILLEQLKARVKNNQRVETTDEWGNITYVECNIFTDAELVWFLRVSLSEFNQTPHFTDYHFSDQVIYERFAYIIIEGAFIIAMAAQMLIEVGKEFTIQDNGIVMNPPPISAMLNNELSTFVTRHGEALKFIKGSIKPHPLGFGGFRIMGASPAMLRLRHLRERRII